MIKYNCVLDCLRKLQLRVSIRGCYLCKSLTSVANTTFLGQSDLSRYVLKECSRATRCAADECCHSVHVGTAYLGQRGARVLTLLAFDVLLPKTGVTPSVPYRTVSVTSAVLVSSAR